jgi:hypothetical protein
VRSELTNQARTKTGPLTSGNCPVSANGIRRGYYIRRSAQVLVMVADSDRQCITVDEDERGGVHEVGPRRRIGKTLAVSAARPAKAAFSRVKALIVAA